MKKRNIIHIVSFAISLIAIGYIMKSNNEILGFERVAESGRVIIERTKSISKIITVKTDKQEKQIILDYGDVQLEEYLGVPINFIPLENISSILMQNKEYHVYKYKDNLYVHTSLEDKKFFFKIIEVKENTIFIEESNFLWNIFAKAFFDIDKDMVFDLNDKDLFLNLKRK